MNRTRTESRDRDDRSSRSDRSENRQGDKSESQSQSQWRSFGERLQDRMASSAADRLHDRLHDLADRRERMPLNEVKEAREFVKNWKPEQVSEQTKARYAALNERMQRTGQPPEKIAHTTGSFKIYRAALVHEARSELKHSLKERDALLRAQKNEKADAKSEQDPAKNRAQLRDVEQRIRDAKAILEKYPPGTGDPREDMKRNSVYAGEKHSDKSNGKRDVLNTRPPDWRDLVWQKVTERDRDAVAVAALTGARPAELEKGVRVSHEKNGDLKFTIYGAKIDEEKRRGQEVRTITISRDEASKSSEGRHLLESVKEGKGRDVRIGDPGNFAQRIASAGDRAGLERVSPYDFRHAFSSRLKADDRLKPADRAVALGQQAERSQEVYGRASSAGRSGAGSISSARASSGTRPGR